MASVADGVIPAGSKTEVVCEEDSVHVFRRDSPQWVRLSSNIILFWLPHSAVRCEDFTGEKEGGNWGEGRVLVPGFIVFLVSVVFPPPPPLALRPPFSLHFEVLCVLVCSRRSL